jgi:hypothetical protein
MDRIAASRNSPQRVKLLLFNSSGGHRRMTQMRWRREAARSQGAGFSKLLPSYSQALLTLNFADKWLVGRVWPQFEPLGEASTMIAWTGVDGVDGVDKVASSGNSLLGSDNDVGLGVPENLRIFRD